jgi:hypothetical protein
MSQTSSRKSENPRMKKLIQFPKNMNNSKK